MAAVEKSFRHLSQKLGLSDEEKILSKASELFRLLQNKSLTGSNISETSKMVICLDLGASLQGHVLDSKTAAKYSGLKTPSYMSCRKTIENLLELKNTVLSISTLCVALQCVNVQTLAENILQEYQSQTKMEVDLSLPQYYCMAVYHACRLQKVKISKSKLLEKSCLKPSQWTKLDGEWTPFVDKHLATQKKGRVVKQDISEVPSKTDEILMEIDCNPSEKTQIETEIEPYEDWKKRMLDLAYEELREIEKNEFLSLKMANDSPRRSPRKTPQKFSPYKEAKENMKGVRLLFPMS